MRTFILSLALVFALMVTTQQTAVISKQVQQYFGVANDWKDYEGSEDGIYVDVTFPETIQFTNPPFVSTHLTCSTHCWTTEGATSVYNLTNTGFRVYIRQDGINAARAQTMQWKLNFKLESMD